MLVIIIVVVPLLVVVYSSLKWWFKDRTRGHTNGLKLPGPRGYILFGNSFDISPTDGLGNAKKLSILAKQYGPIYCLKVFGQNIVYLNSGEIILEALTDPSIADNINDRPATVFSDLIQYGGIVAQKDGNGYILKGLRRNFVQGLHIYGEGVKKFEDIMLQELSRLGDQIEAFGEDEFVFNDVMSESLFNVISILLIGKPIPDDPMMKSFSGFTTKGDELLSPSVSNVVMTFPFLRYISKRYKALFQSYESSVQHILAHYFNGMKKTFVPGNIRGLVDFYLNEQLKHPEDVDVLSDKRLPYAILDVIGAGFLTSMSAISGLILCLIRHPEIQQRIQTEIDAIKGKPTLEDRKSCPYVEATIMEALRYLSITPYLVPRVCKRDCILRGYHIPQDSVVIMNSWHYLHDEEVWGDPWTFRPDRFLDEYGQLENRGEMFRKGFIVFGVGRRRCPGDSLAISRIFLYLTTLLNDWTILPPKYQQLSCDPRNGDYDVFLMSTPKPFKCIMKRRLK